MSPNERDTWIVLGMWLFGFALAAVILSTCSCAPDVEVPGPWPKTCEWNYMVCYKVNVVQAPDYVLAYVWAGECSLLYGICSSYQTQREQCKAYCGATFDEDKCREGCITGGVN